jgi:hypothetical protein
MHKYVKHLCLKYELSYELFISISNFNEGLQRILKKQRK